jgi:CRP-like cAMP-binding protein
VERVESGTHFGSEAVLKKGTRISTISAITDSIVLAFDPNTVAELASRNGDFLSLLNQRMVLGQDRIMKTKRRLQREESKAVAQKKRSRVSGAIQTFFTDLFPSPPPSVNPGSNQSSQS